MTESNVGRIIQVVNTTSLYYVGLVYLCIAAAHFFAISDPTNRTILVSLAFTTATSLFASAWYLRRVSWDTTLMSQGFFIVALALNSFVHMGLTEEIIQSTNIIIILLVLGGSSTNSKFFFCTLTMTVLVWGGLIMVIEATVVQRTHFIFALVLSLAASIFIYRHRTVILARIIEQERENLYLANYDSLTNCLRRHAFDQRGQAMLAEAQRAGKTTAILFCDLDYFKRLNDGSGHPAGDRALQLVGQLLADTAKQHQLLCGRMGGEEFALIGQIDRTEAQFIGEKILQQVAQLKVEHPDSPISSYLTTSIGFTWIVGQGCNFSELCSVADKALYQAKALGRNRVESKACCD